MNFKKRISTRRRALAVLVAGMAMPWVAQATHYKVYLLGGQSNASGRGDASELSAPYDSPQTDVALYWHKTLVTDNGNLVQDSWVDLQVDSGQGKNSPSGHAVEFGPELAFGRALADADPSANVAIIKYAHGGSNLHTQWADGGEMYATFLATVESALAALTEAGHTYELIGMFWQQGEADTGAAYADYYEANLTDLIARVRADLFGGLSLPFVIGGLSVNQYSSITDTTTGAGKVRLAQETVAQNVDGVGFADADDCAVYDSYNIHFNWAGQLALGAAHAAEMLRLEALDADYDGLTADQEAAWGTDSANADSDGDGQKDGLEVRAGTHPLNSNSLFRVAAIGVVSNQVSLTWPSRAGNAYGVESSTNLTNWTSVVADFPASTGESNTVWSSAGSEEETEPSNILALYDMQTGINGDFNTTAFDSVDAESSTTATRMKQGGSLTKFVLSHSLFNSTASGSPGLNLADAATASQAAAAAAGDWFSFTIEPNGNTVEYQKISFYSDQFSTGAKVDVSYSVGAVDTFVVQGLVMEENNVPLVYEEVDFVDFSSDQDVVWTFYIYGAASSSYGNRFDDIALHGTSDAVIEEPEEPSAVFYRVNLQ